MVKKLITTDRFKNKIFKARDKFILSYNTAYQLNIYIRDIL